MGCWVPFLYTCVDGIIIMIETSATHTFVKEDQINVIIIELGYMPHSYHVPVHSPQQEYKQTNPVVPHPDMNITNITNGAYIVYRPRVIFISQVS